MYIIMAPDVMMMTKSLKTEKQRATVKRQALSTLALTFNASISGQLVLFPLGSFKTLYTSFFDLRGQAWCSTEEAHCCFLPAFKVHQHSVR